LHLFVRVSLEEAGGGGGGRGAPDKARPLAGAADPQVFVLSRNHLGDLDIGGYSLDVFDLIRMMRNYAWQEPLTSAGRLDFDRDGAITARDIETGFSIVGAVDRAADESGVDVDRIDADAPEVCLP